MPVKWLYQVRPGSPRGGNHLRPEDFFRPDRLVYTIFERGIEVDMYFPHSNTIILRNREFCVVKQSSTSQAKPSRESYIFCVCLPWEVQGREVVFYSPTIDPLTIQ